MEWFVLWHSREGTRRKALQEMNLENCFLGWIREAHCDSSKKVLIVFSRKLSRQIQWTEHKVWCSDINIWNKAMVLEKIIENFPRSTLHSSCKSFWKLREKILNYLDPRTVTEAWLNLNFIPPEDTETKLLAGAWNVPRLYIIVWHDVLELFLLASSNSFVFSPNTASWNYLKTRQ